MELLDHRQTGASAFEGIEEHSHRRLHLGVRIQDDAIAGVMDEADRDHLLEFAAAGATQDARRRALSTWSSASLIAPFNPSNNLSLKLAGSYSPSSSRMSVSLSAQSSSSRCQSVLLRASRDTSNPSTIPTRPRLTSVTRRWKPSRSAAPAPDCPRSQSMTTIRSSGQPSATARSRNPYWRWVLSVFSNT